MALSASGWRHNKLLMEEIEPLDPQLASSAIGRRVLALNNEHAEELSWLDADRLVELTAGPSWPAASAPSMPSCSLRPGRRLRQPQFPVVPLALPALRVCRPDRRRPRRADAATPAGCTTTFSSTLFAPATNASSARSTASRPIPRRMPSMRRWASARSARRDPRRSKTVRYLARSSAKRAPSGDRGSPSAAPAPWSAGRAAAGRPAPARTRGSCL